MHWIAFAMLAILAFASRAAPANAAELHIEDVAFLLYAMEVDRSQVRLGQLATDKAQEERVRQYGRFMINDHQRANARVTKIAAEYGVEPPQEVSPVAQRMQEWLQRLSRAQFDDQYIATQVIYHYSAHYLYKRENLHGRDEQLRREAGQQVEILEAHRSAAEQIARQLPPSQARLHAEDLTFLLYAMDIDLTQVQLSRLAAEKAGNERVRQFAGRMLDYHTRARIRGSRASHRRTASSRCKSLVRLRARCRSGCGSSPARRLTGSTSTPR
jgi:putative membrane protein